MARNYGHIMSAIWNDSEFRRLSVAAQRTYLMLITQADISSAGTLPLTIRRWAAYAIDSTPDRLSDSLSELAGYRFLVIDEATEEVLIRTFVKWDGGYTNVTKRQPAIRRDASAVASPKIRACLAEELDSLEVPHDLEDRVSDGLSGTVPDSPGVVSNATDAPQPTTHNPQPLEAVAEKAIMKRGSRLPADWRPPDKTRDWTLERLSKDRASTELEKFRNYWLAKAGKDATKLDWDRTWRNWVLTAAGNAPANGNHPIDETDPAFQYGVG